MTKLTKSNRREEGVYLAHNSRLQPIILGKARQTSEAVESREVKYIKTACCSLFYSQRYTCLNPSLVGQNSWNIPLQLGKGHWIFTITGLVLIWSIGNHKTTSKQGFFLNQPQLKWRAWSLQQKPQSPSFEWVILGSRHDGTHLFNSSTQEEEAGSSLGVQSQPGLQNNFKATW